VANFRWGEPDGTVLAMKMQLCVWIMFCFVHYVGAHASARLDLYTRLLPAGATQRPSRVRPQRMGWAANHVVTHCTT
jgi:hypothetical protein